MTAGGTLNSDRTQVVVVGGGPAGAATAFYLARAGVDVTVLDRARFPRDKPCSEYMSPQASRILDDMGVLHRIEESGGAHLGGMRVRAPSGVTFQGRFAEVEGYSGYRDRGLALRRTILDKLLLDRARECGANVREGVRVTTIVNDSLGRAVGVELLDSNGAHRSLSCDIVIAADGLRSTIARRVSLTATRLAQRRLAFVTHFIGIEGMSDNGEMHVERDGYLGLADVGGGVTNVAVVVPHAQARAAAGDSAGFVDDWIRRRRHVMSRFANAVRVTPVLATGPFASHSRRAWAPGVALVGDAADFFDPFTGEGIYAALRGAELLAPHVVSALTGTARDADASLAAYDRVRVREFAGKWVVERIIGAAVTFPSLMNVAARSLALRPTMAHTIVGVTGDFVPAREVLRPGFLARLLMPWKFGAKRVAPALTSSESS